MKLTIRILFVVSVLLGGGLYFIGQFVEPQDNLPDPVVITGEDNIDISPEGVIQKQEVPVTPIVQEVQISAAGAYNLLTDENLYEFRTEKRWPIASITKLMTTIVAHEFLDATDTIEITEEILAIEGESGGFSLGEVYTIESLINSMMLVSSNDAAYALAEHFGEEEFIAEMNIKAKEIGMMDTNFYDSSGLSPQNLSTVEDLRTLAKYIWLEEQSVLSVTRSKSGIIREVNTGIVRNLININAFAGRPGFLGGKTGRIPDSGENLLSIFIGPDNSTPIVIIVLGTGDRFYETEKILMKL